MPRFAFPGTAAAVLAAASVFAQPPQRSALFGEADSLLQALSAGGDTLFAPRTYAAALEAYRRADEAFREQQPAEEVREELRGTVASLRSALRIGQRGRLFFADNIEARAAAVRARATGSAEAGELFQQAEQLYASAIEDLERGREGSAQGDRAESHRLFALAELTAIKERHVGEVRRRIRATSATEVRNLAPASFGKAEGYLRAAEASLEKNRYDTVTAIQWRDAAAYEISHAVFLSRQIADHRTRKAGEEDIFLALEKPLAEIARRVEVPARFDTAHRATAVRIMAEIDRRDQLLADAQDNLRRLQSDSAARAIRVASLEKDLQAALVTSNEFRSREDLRRQQSALFDSVSAMFTRQEAEVSRDGDKIVIRPVGLKFSAAGEELESKYFPLLKRVSDAIKRVPRSLVNVKGHTETLSSADAAQRLSEQRAEAVAEFLRAQLDSSFDVLDMGYGDTKPLMSQNNPKWREINRRIEIEIVPEWARHNE